MSVKTTSGPRDRTRRPWRPEDGDSRCQDCGSPNPVWWVQHDFWTKVTAGKEGVLCPNCFMLEAEDQGIGRSGAWQIYPPGSLH